MNNIISIDETSIDSHISHNYGWSISGEKITIIKTHPRIRYSVIAATSNNKIIYYEIIKGSVNGETFLNFMKTLIDKLQNDNKYHIILDNARIHHYKEFKKYVIKNPNFEIIYNVPPAG
jgi:hypothetical protein